ncbi:MAG: neutral zinc metallopeptidase [Actinomycetota bacterium]|nr:neutral zinc metallopeptidase [Actinomycetota bacterium]
MTKIRSTDKSRIDDRRGQGGGGFGLPGGIQLPGSLKAGGGILGVIVLVAALLLPKLLGAGTTANGATGSTGSAAAADCVTELEQIVCGVTNDVQDYWAQTLPAAFGVDYQYTVTQWFEGGTDTACGQASSQTGPFYCPADSVVYIDLGFLQQLEEQLVGQTSDLAEQYILAHEYGHHVQNLLGTNDMVQQAQQNDPDKGGQYSIALELQADCFAGAWVGARNVLESAAELDEAIKAAEGVGDDRIQMKTQGRVDPESWTHGSAEQRKTWFLTGHNSQDPVTCDTFAEIQ